MSEYHTRNVDEETHELGRRVMDAMLEESPQQDGSVKYSIPREIFSGEAHVVVDGKKYTIYDIPGVENVAGTTSHGALIERAIEKFTIEHGSSVSNIQIPEAIDLQGGWASLTRVIYLKA